MCVREMKATIMTTQGHLFKDNKPAINAELLWHVPALKAKMGADTDPIWLPLFVIEFITLEVF